MEIGSFVRAAETLGRAGFEGGNGVRVLEAALARLGRNASPRRIEASLIGSRAMLERAVREGIGSGVTTQGLADAHRAAGNVLAMLRSVDAPLSHEATLLGRAKPVFSAQHARAYLAGSVRSAP